MNDISVVKKGKPSIVGLSRQLLIPARPSTRLTFSCGNILNNRSHTRGAQPSQKQCTQGTWRPCKVAQFSI